MLIRSLSVPLSLLRAVLTSILLTYFVTACGGGGGDDSAIQSGDSSVVSQPDTSNNQLSANAPSSIITNIEDGVIIGADKRWMCHSPSDILTSSNEVIVTLFNTGDAIFFRTSFSGTPGTDVPLEIGVQTTTWEWNGSGVEIISLDNGDKIVEFGVLEEISDTLFTARLSNREAVSAPVECFLLSQGGPRLVNPTEYPAWELYIQLENAGTQGDPGTVFACTGLLGNFIHVFGFYPVFESIYSPFDNGRFTASNRELRITRTQSPTVSVLVGDNDTSDNTFDYEFNNIQFVDDDTFTADLLPVVSDNSFPFFTTCDELSVSS